MKTDMPACSCNSHKADPEHIQASESRSKKFMQRCAEVIKMSIPAIVFAIIPKCPVCLAGYVALSTGIGLSITTATYIRIVLIILCILSITYFIIKHVHRLIVWVLNIEW